MQFLHNQNLRWVMSTIFYYKRYFLEVVVAAGIFQLLAIVMPVVTQVIFDKVYEAGLVFGSGAGIVVCSESFVGSHGTQALTGEIYPGELETGADDTIVRQHGSR